MRQILALILLLSCLPITATATPWCDGYQKGYEQGYQSVRDNWVTPPSCPINRRINPENYQGGYERGHRDGERQAKEECSMRRGGMNRPRGCR